MADLTPSPFAALVEALIGAVMEWMCCDPDDEEKAAESKDAARSALLAAIEEAVPKQCAWTDDDEGIWHTACGNLHVINDGTPAENSMRYCCYCGGALPQPPKETKDGLS